LKADRQSFWQMQDQARGQTIWLTVVFAAVFAFTITVTVIATRIGIQMLVASETDSSGTDFLIESSQAAFPNFFDLLAIVLSSGVVLIGAWIKHTQLADGGHVIAHMMGGRRIDSDPRNPKERRLLNVVEEMSIASGIPVPPVYVLHNESSINAFAAGLNPANAVLGFSSGSIEKLNRDELQGVVAHEFSHIFNGDMRLNMRLITLIAGLQSIAHVGRFLLDSDNHRSTSDDRDDKLALFGFILMLVGLFGAFMAGIVKAAVSRQREYLADATAMQYTRNPDGIGGALLKILKGDFTLGNYFAKEASHFLFAAESSYFSMSTHPPLRDRVKRVAPDLLKAFENGSLKIEDEPATESFQTPINASQKAQASRLSTVGFAAAGFSPNAAPSATKAPPTSTTTESHSVPIIQTTFDATIAITSILAVENLRIVQNKKTAVDSSVGVNTASVIKTFSEDSEFEKLVHQQIANYMAIDLNTALEMRATVMKLALPHVRKMAKLDREKFYKFAESLCRTNEHISIFEGACLAVLRKAFAIPAEKATMSFTDSASHLLSAISNSVQSPHPENETVDALKAFQAGRTFLISQKIPGLQVAQIRYIRAADQSGTTLTDAIWATDRQSLKLKRTILLAIECVALFDRRLSIGEAELLRMIGLALDLPNPNLESSTQ